MNTGEGVSFVGKMSAAKTASESYVLRIIAENFATPHQMKNIYDERQKLSADDAKWIEGVLENITLNGDALASCHLKTISPYVNLYHTHEGVGLRRYLVVGVAGAAGRLMLPVSFLCQSFDFANADLVVIQDPSQKAFLKGVPGYAESVGELALRLKEDLALDRYEAVAFIGTSMGGGCGANARLFASRVLRRSDCWTCSDKISGFIEKTCGSVRDWKAY